MTTLNDVLVPNRACDHAELTFGSGDYYIFCHACGRKWAVMGKGDEYGIVNGKPVGADASLQGDGHVCGQKRVTEE